MQRGEQDRPQAYRSQLVKRAKRAATQAAEQMPSRAENEQSNGSTLQRDSEATLP